MKKFYFLFVSLGLLLSGYCLAQNPSSFTRLDKIVAVVNTDIITQSQLNKEMATAKKQLEHEGGPMPSEKDLRKDVLDQMIAKNLQMQLAKAKDVQVTEADVDKVIANITKNNKMNLEQLKQALTQSDTNYTEFRSRIHDQIMMQKLQQQEVAKNVSVSPTEVKEFYRTNNGKSQYNAFHLVDVLLPLQENAPQAKFAELQEQARALIQALSKNEDIDDALKSYPTAEKSDLGWRAINEVPSLFQPKVASLRIKQMTPPIQAPNGIHILKLVDAKGENIKITEKDAQNMVFQHKMVEEIKLWVAKLRKDAFVKIIG